MKDEAEAGIGGEHGMREGWRVGGWEGGMEIGR